MVERPLTGCAASSTRSRAAVPIVLKEDFPGSGPQTHTQLAEFARQNARTMCHPVGTCRMGNDEEAVVDGVICGVRGLEGSAWCIDSSVMPDIVSGNTAVVRPRTSIGSKRGAHIRFAQQ